MPIARAPQTSVRQDDRRADELISRAGNGNRTQPVQAEIALTVRVSPAVLEQIDQRVRARRVKTPRHAWLLEAIYAKLDSENGG
jgi:hypothetical protein